MYNLYKIVNPNGNFKDSYKKITGDKDIARKIAGKAVLELRKKIFSLYEYPRIKQCYI